MTLRFHQIHCLATLRRSLQLAQDGQDIDEGVPHCLDYLYQVLSLLWNRKHG